MLQLIQFSRPRSHFLSCVQVSGWRKQLDDKEKPETYVVSRYLDQPLLMGGRKFDLRIFVLVLSYVPLVVYLHRQASPDYSQYMCCWIACHAVYGTASCATLMYRGKHSMSHE